MKEKKNRKYDKWDYEVMFTGVESKNVKVSFTESKSSLLD